MSSSLNKKIIFDSDERAKYWSYSSVLISYTAANANQEKAVLNNTRALIYCCNYDQDL